MLGEQIDVVLQVTRVLDALGAPYVLGGSFASGVDVFVARARPFDRSQLDRRQEYELGGLPESKVYVASAEDIALAKLEWYRMGGEVSERQWRDVLGVLRVQGDRLDCRYMREMAKTMDVVDLLERALDEAA